MKIGASSICFPFDNDHLSLLAKEGVTELELSFSLKDCESISAKKAVGLAQDCGLHVPSFHLPFSSPTVLELAAEDANIRRKTVALFCKLIKEYSGEGVKKFIIHPSSEPVSTDSEKRKKRLSDTRDALSSLAEVAALHGSVIAVENLPRTCLGSIVDELEYLISGSTKLGVCFDTNHLLTDTNEELIRRLGHRIIAVHVSDYDRINERHWLPGEGDVDWHSLYHSLIASGFSGVWLYEIANNKKTILRERDITPADLYNNAQQIFKDLPITTFSKRIAGLGMWP